MFRGSIFILIDPGISLEAFTCDLHPMDVEFEPHLRTDMKTAHLEHTSAESEVTWRKRPNVNRVFRNVGRNIMRELHSSQSSSSCNFLNFSPNSRFRQRWLRRLLSNEMWRCIVWYKFNDVTEERIITSSWLKNKPLQSLRCVLLACLDYPSNLKLEAVSSFETQ